MPFVESHSALGALATSRVHTDAARDQKERKAMRRHLRVLTVSATLTLFTFGLAAPAQAAVSGGKPPLTILTKVVGDVLGADDD